MPAADRFVRGMSPWSENDDAVLGWYRVCKVRGIGHHTAENEKALKGSFDFFLRYVLPVMSTVEKHVSPPIGLNLIAVFRRRT